MAEAAETTTAATDLHGDRRPVTVAVNLHCHFYSGRDKPADPQGCSKRLPIREFGGFPSVLLVLLLWGIRRYNWFGLRNMIRVE